MKLRNYAVIGVILVGSASLALAGDDHEVENAGATTWEEPAGKDVGSRELGWEVTASAPGASRGQDGLSPFGAPTGAPEADVPIPPNWIAVTLGAPNNGVRVYRQGNEYVIVLDMRMGTVKLLTGAVVTPPGEPNYKRVYRKKTTDFWPDAVAQNTASAKVKVVVGGTFGAWDQPTGIAFGLKQAGSLISYGYGAPGGPQPEYPGQIKLITFNNAMNRAWIGPYSLDSFASPDLMGALEVDADKEPYKSKGRTFLGVRDNDSDGDFETVLVFTSPSSIQSHASSVLSAFGAQQKAMIDGSGSTFLIIDGVTKIASSDGRSIAQATAFYASP